MSLAAVALAFLWVAQVLLYEPSYLNATTDDLFARTEAAARELESAPPGGSGDRNNPLVFLSKTITGIVFLVNGGGDIMLAYNNGRATDDERLSSDYAWLLGRYPSVVGGESVRKIERLTKANAIIVGIPLTYRGESGAILLYQYITQVETLRAINRRQLISLSVVLTLMASLISFLLARHFSRPILQIKAAVEKLTEGDLDASPQVSRGDELGALSSSVEALGSELRRVDVLRKEVIANVSHELRAPLSLITGYGEMVRDVTGGCEETRNQNMDLIIREANRLSEMVDDIMGYSQMQAGYSELKLETCNLRELALSAAEYGRGAARQYGVSVAISSCSEDIPVRLDAVKIGQVLRNLLNNAVNHTEDGGRIDVEITREENALRVSVVNPGEEIPPDQMEQIWERYQRVQHQGGRREGTGIGLAIVSTILSAHGLSYGADSKDGCNRFWFDIPNDRIL